VIQSEFDSGESAESIGFSHCQFGLVVQALDDAAGELLFGSAVCTVAPHAIAGDIGLAGAVCMLVLIGVTPRAGRNSSFQTGVRESAQSWCELLIDVKRRGLETAPDFAIGDGASRSS
jgi:hypothetical protein